ncbi:30S ribosome-binding factor RbfA [Patescibacteria group bacterium]|nr:30S ribosome-binding factor RbfA [Patescibacteria group bacterium]
MSSKRVEQVNELIKREMSRIFLREVEAPEGSLITITRVETSSDLLEAKIWVSVFPINKAKVVLTDLLKKIGYLQGLLNRRLVMKPLPRIKFLSDQTEEEVSQVEDLLKKAKG